MQPLKITVVTVSYNAAATIEETIRSVVDQTYDNVEYIIVDGGSTDGTVDIIRRYAEGGSEAGKHNHVITRWISEPDRGIYDAMNKGIDLASGDYINFMNAGDTFYDDYVFENVIKEAELESDVLYGDNMLIYNLQTLYHRAEFFSAKDLNLPFNHQATFCKCDLAKSNLFNLSYKIASDYKFFYSLYKTGRTFQYIPIPISNYAMDGMSQDNVIKMIKEVFDIKGHKRNIKYYGFIFFMKIKIWCKSFLPDLIIRMYRNRIYSFSN